MVLDNLEGLKNARVGVESAFAEMQSCNRPIGMGEFDHILADAVVDMWSDDSELAGIAIAIIRRGRVDFDGPLEMNNDATLAIAKTIETYPHSPKARDLFVYRSAQLKLCEAVNDFLVMQQAGQK